jgi:hypothetical protein
MWLHQPASSEVVHRPPPGLARGVWEASPLSFYVALVSVVALFAIYVAVRVRRGRRRR